MGINGKHLETRVREEEKIARLWARAVVTGVSARCEPTSANLSLYLLVVLFAANLRHLAEIEHSAAGFEITRKPTSSAFNGEKGIRNSYRSRGLVPRSRLAPTFV